MKEKILSQDQINLREIVARELHCSINDLIWSPKCGNPKTQRKNHELGTLMMDMGYWVRKLDINN